MNVSHIAWIRSRVQVNRSHFIRLYESSGARAVNGRASLDIRNYLRILGSSALQFYQHT